MSKLFLDSNTLFNMSNTLYKKLDYKPDAILGVSRGGCIPGIIIHERFNYEEQKCSYFTITTKSYDNDNNRGDNIFIDMSEHTKNELKNMCNKILIVDDVFDSGITCMEIGNYLYNECGITSDKFKFATIYYKPTNNQTTIIPHYYVETTDKWIVFPHELMGLTDSEIEKKNNL